MKNIRHISKKYTIGAAIVALPLVAGIVFLANTNQNSSETLRQAQLLQAKAAVVSQSDSEQFKNYQKPSNAELKNSLSAIQYAVSQQDATETPFQNQYWDLEEEGIYVDVVSGEPLFSSRDKYESGTGWPSFTKPLNADSVVVKEDSKLGVIRIEARSKYADSHLGHVFNDGPTILAQSEGAEPTGLRYCLNSAALLFIPKADLEKEGIGEYASSFSRTIN